ncbi:MAG TPA: myo-inositol-1-phosphate synthase, partial [Planctomycetaceae bacterium]|nr:myo-inositol-1-phosphate synthase [Planctomycetaceae bacterium]
MGTANIGIWLIGAKGNVATSAILGLSALARGLIDQTGLVTALPSFRSIGLSDWSRFVVGGHEIREVGLFRAALRLSEETGAVDRELVAACREDLEAIESRIRPGTVLNVGATIAGFAASWVPRAETPRQAVARLEEDLRCFAEGEGLEHVVVINVASTEPRRDPAEVPGRWSELEALLERPEACPLPASSLYAIAALGLGYSYINFTPSLGSAPRAIDELGRRRGARHMGCDGK